MSLFDNLQNVYGLEIEKILINMHSNQDSDMKEFKVSFESLSEKIDRDKKVIKEFSLDPDEKFFNDTTNKIKD